MIEFKTTLKHLFACLIAVGCLGLSFPHKAIACQPSQAPAPRSRVLAALEERNFALLESEAERDRASQARTPSGLWELTYYYGELSAALTADGGDSKSWESLQAAVDGWVARYPKSPTAHLAYAQVLINRAWSYRGCGYAYTVDPNVWPTYRQYIDRAKAYLTANKVTASRDPRWYELMEGIAREQSWDEQKFKEILDEGLARYPRFYPIYFGAIEYYAPKWGGSDQAIEDFAVEAMQRTRTTEGAGMYARIYWYASQTQYDNRLFSDSRVKWRVMKQGIKDVLAKYPDDWNVNNFARFACLASDKDLTADLMGRIKSPPDPNAWDDISFYESCRTWSRGPTRAVGVEK